MCSKASRRSMRAWPSAIRRSSSTERTSEPSCSSWLFLLPVFVVVELTLHAGGLFVEEIGQMPEQIVEVGLEARVAEGAGKDVEEVRDGAGEKVRFGKRAGIGLVAGWADSRRVRGCR